MHAPSSAASPDTPPVAPCQPRPRTPGTTAYRICTTDGTLVATHHRSDTIHGKRFWWTRPDGSTGLDRPVTELPLYRSETLRDAPPGALVVLVEGERAADALAARSIRAVATVTGSSAIPKDAVLETLRHYDVVLWPDADAPGRQHMQRIAERLHALGIPVQLYDPWPDRTDGVDAADIGDDVEDHILLARIVLTPDWTPPEPADVSDGDAERPSPPARGSRAHRLLAALDTRVVVFAEALTGTLYVDIHVSDDTRITMPWGGTGSEAALMICHLLHVLGEETPSSAIFRELLHLIQARALSKPRHAVHLRTASVGDTLYWDLGEPHSSAAIRITADGWDIVTQPPVRFARRKTTMPLPRPSRPGTLTPLRMLLAVDDEAWVTIVSWVLAALAPEGPYPILAIEGPPGASKSTTARILRSIIDPSAAPLVAEPRDAVDLLLIAAAARVIAIDNLPSTLPGPMVDALCRIATDGAIITRQLYSDQEITVHRGARPVILTSVGSVLSRGDLADRALPVPLPTLDDARRATETELREAMGIAAPHAVAAIADALACGLRTRDLPRPTRPVRMMDAAMWAARCAPALDIAPDAILETYARGRDLAYAAAIEADPVATAIIGMVEAQGSWTGTPTQLLEALRQWAPASAAQQRWPQDARSMSRRLRMLAPALADRRIVYSERRSKTQRVIAIQRHDAE